MSMISFSLCLVCLECCMLLYSSRLEKWCSHSFTNLLCEHSLVTTMLHYPCLHRRWCDGNSRMCLLTCTWSSTLPRCSSPQHTAVPASECICIGNLQALLGAMYEQVFLMTGEDKEIEEGGSIHIEWGLVRCTSIAHSCLCIYSVQRSTCGSASNTKTASKGKRLREMTIQWITWATLQLP